MGLQLYAQPLVSTGRYSESKEPINPQADDYDDRYYVFQPGDVTTPTMSARSTAAATAFRTSGFELADFNFRELRSNLVFRWEYRPGSGWACKGSHRRAPPGVTRVRRRPDVRLSHVICVSAPTMSFEQGRHW